MIDGVVNDILVTSIIKFVKVLPRLIVAVVASQVVKGYLSHRKISSKFKESESNIAKASAVGIMTPGPLMAFLPLLKDFKKKGLPLSIVAAFITGQAMIGPMRLFLESSYFGVMFFVYKVILAFFIAIAIGTCFVFLEKKIKF